MLNSPVVSPCHASQGQLPLQKPCKFRWNVRYRQRFMGLFSTLQVFVGIDFWTENFPWLIRTSAGSDAMFAPFSVTKTQSAQKAITNHRQDWQLFGLSGMLSHVRWDCFLTDIPVELRVQCQHAVFCALCARHVRRSSTLISALNEATAFIC